MSEWQLIETAPKDGRFILATPCFGTSKTPYQIYWFTGKKQHWLHGATKLTANPTHWMPLPQPPEGAKP
jgi:hypothetical protein